MGKGCVFPRPGRPKPRGRVHATFLPNIKGKTDIIALHDIADIIALQMTFFVYRADGVDVAPEIERNLARAKHVAWPSCAWQLLNFFPFPVLHPPHPPCSSHEDLWNLPGCGLLPL